MKKKIFGILGVAVIGATVVVNFNMNLGGTSLSDIALANVEALATSETGNDCTGSFYKNYTFSGSATGLVNANGTSSCSLPCPNVTTNGVYGDTYKCMN